MARIDPIDRKQATGKARVAPAEVSDEQVEQLRELGYSDEQLAEVVGLVALNVLTGAFNLVAGIHPTETARRAT